MKRSLMRGKESTKSSSLMTMEGRRTAAATTTPCCSKVGLKRGPWTAEEDELLASVVRREGEGRWRTLPKRAGLLRCGKSCRLRWMNYLRPCIKRGPIDPDEEDLILRLHRLLGNRHTSSLSLSLSLRVSWSSSSNWFSVSDIETNRWSLIAGRIPGRTDNEIKNYWNTHLSKKLVKQGIDPRTHKPFSSSSAASSTTDQYRHHRPAAANPNNSCMPHESAGTAPGDEAVGAIRSHRSFYFDDLNLHHDDVGWHNGGELFAAEGNQMMSSTCDNRKGAAAAVEGCTDDVFSALFDSFINEDIFMHNNNNNNCSQDGDDDNNNNNNEKSNSKDEMIDPMSTSFSLEGLWEDDAFASSTVNLEEGFPAQ